VWLESAPTQFPSLVGAIGENGRRRLPGSLMATVDVAVSSDLIPEQAWALASDLRRFEEWLTILGGWRSEVSSAPS
jgi:hypothetical protein